MTKKTYLGLRPKKALFGAAASFAIIICGLASSQAFYEIIISVFSIMTILYVVEGKWIGCACGIIFCLVYALAVSFTRQFYGLMVFQLFICMPLYAVSLVNWKKNQNKNTVAVKRLKANRFILVVVASAAAYCVLFATLQAVGSSNAVFDSLTVIFGMSGMTLMSLRYAEQWYFHLASNLSAVVMWLIKSFESIINLNFLIIALIFAASNIIGLVSWLKMGNNGE